jgi:hypothetical protein
VSLAEFDVRHLSRRDVDEDQDGAALVEDGPAPGAWPESVEVSYFADSATTLPGMGERGANCGEWYPAEFCESCGTVHAGVSRCQQRGCPDCWATWTGNRAEAIVRRLTAYRFSQPPGVERRVVHAVASPPPGEVRTLTDVGRYRRKAQERLKQRGVRGGVMVFHGFRVKQEVKETYWELRDAGAVSGGLWQFVRENGRDWRSQTYWSPHYHVIGAALEFEADDSEDDWVIRRLSSADSLRSLRDDGAYTSVAKMSRYILSHATFEPDGVRAVTWFGELHSTQFDPEAELSAGALSVIERKAAEAVGRPVEDGAGSESDDERRCEEDDCDGELHAIWDAGLFLMDMDWCESVGREAEHRLAVAFEWAVGERQPPPGLKRPRSREEYAEAFDVLLG